MDSIKVGTNTTLVEDNSPIFVTPITNTPIEVDKSGRVTVSPRSYQIVSQDVFVTRRNDDIPDWLEDQIENIVDGSTLADDVSDLTNQFNDFDDGITREIGYLKEGQEATAYSLEVLKTSNDTNTAGIQNLEVTKVTEGRAVAISKSTIGAWQNDGDGAAWFDSEVSVVSDVAYSAARSASTLSASIIATDQRLVAIAGDIDILQSQVDGKVETWFSEENPVNPDGSLNENVEPYKTWLAENDIARHTGDTYVWFEYDAFAPDQKNLLVTYRFAYDTDLSDYKWYIFKDDLASTAYQEALAASTTADGKITTYYQTFPPTPISNPELSDGDLWVDSDNDNTLKRYDSTLGQWVGIDNRLIEASVARLDEATVTVDGVARARSSLTVGAGDAISGFVIAADDSPVGGPSSSFKIFTDKFILAKDTGDEVGAPFIVDGNNIKFNGIVSFAGTPVDTALQAGEAATDINTNTTTINGGKITTNSIDANKITTNTLWVDGNIKSSNYYWNGSTSSTPTGFKLSSTGDYGYNIIGGKIYGGTIRATTLDAVTINTGTLNADIINSGSITNNSRDSISNSRDASTEVGWNYDRYDTLSSFYVSNSNGTGNLITVNIKTKAENLNTFSLEVYRGTSLLFSRALPQTTVATNQYTDITFSDAPYSGTYYIKVKYRLGNWGDTWSNFLISGNSSIVQFKK